MPDLHTGTPLRDAIAASAHILTGDLGDYDPLLDLVGDARFVLLGEASHGTHEFYAERARITQRLITEKGFTAVAVEADWPDSYRVNRYVRGESGDHSAEEALTGFQRFPTWMWRNTDVVEFVEWLRTYNDARIGRGDKVGFYGLDLYSMFSSIAEVLKYLEQVDPKAAQLARERYSCFDHYEDDSQQYGYATGFGMSESCEEGVIDQLRELQAKAGQYLKADGTEAEDEFFQAQQNARLVKNAEEYYRTMFRGRVSSWNLRDRHMAQTLQALDQHLTRTSGKPAKVVVWEHNSHIGDARATEVGQQGEWNVGQLAREAYGDQAVLIGFTTYEGTVTAASAWDAPADLKKVRPALVGSYEEAFHRVGIPRFLLPLRGKSAAADALRERRLERAIGVIYQPATERQSHYFYANLPQQFDAIIHFDETRAVHPLERDARWQHPGDAPETFPEGF